MIVLLIPLAFWLFYAVCGATVLLLIDSRNDFWEKLKVLLIVDTVVIVGLTLLLLTVGYVASSTS